MYCWLDGKTVIVTGASDGMGADIDLFKEVFKDDAEPAE